MEFLRVNTSIWLNFAHRRGFRDQYVSNYYIKRLFAISNLPLHSTSTNFQGFQVRNKKRNYHDLPQVTPKERMHGMLCLSAPNASSCTMAPHDALKSVIPAELCTLNYPTAVILKKLHLAKKMLKEFFDFIIIDFYNVPGAVEVFERTLRYSNKDYFHDQLVAKFITLVNNGTIWKMDGNSRKSYRSMMPSSIADFFEYDNHADIQLYKYAVHLFKERMK